MTQGARDKVAVVGSGVAGLTAAWLLQDRFDICLYDCNDYAGGHTRTAVVKDGPDTGCPIDMGFIVMNHRNYPLLTRLLERLSVDLDDSDMSFSYHCRQSGYSYSGTNLNGLFARRRNIVDPGHWRMIRDIMRFNREATARIQAGDIGDLTLGAFLEQGKYGGGFARHYLAAMGSAIWSAPVGDVMDFPAEPFVRFFHNHGLLTVNDRPQWRCVRGGSQSYVRRMLADFRGEVRLSTPVTSISRGAGNVSVKTGTGTNDVYDRVIIATHADEALAMLDDPSAEERRLLGDWRYQENVTTLHTDPAVMPRQKAAWASWNFARLPESREDKAVAVTYHMNRLQKLASESDYFVSLNMEDEISDDRRLETVVFTHPVYSFESLKTQAELPTLNVQGTTCFCGSYFGYGFHEDAVRAAVRVAERFEVSL